MAWDLLEGGYASVEDIDTAAEKGLGHPMGPFRTMDYSGLDTILSVRKSRYEADPSKYPAPNEILMEKVARGEVGVKAGKGFYDYKK
ncbi:3-hydroxybutyryl-CoA dehydrogenase [bioreactor metagenome]|uniref:3-hydroxybutyryl-CoA dehydrogenase n=1 Tax=bioreactor metagenome TaxID=1076179 RepID=A0A645IMV8_9ZZZZ